MSLALKQTLKIWHNKTQLLKSDTYWGDFMTSLKPLTSLP